jgi:hypothetical protein
MLKKIISMIGNKIRSIFMKEKSTKKSEPKQINKQKGINQKKYKKKDMKK